MESKLSLENVSKHFGSVKALDDVSIDFKPGIYGLIGPNGAGKSTMIRLIATLDFQTSGSIFYGDTPILSLKGAYRELIGLMPQDQKGYDHYSGYAFLQYMALLKGLGRKDAKVQIDALVKQVSLEESIHRKVGTYSGGMRQRLMFAQALLGNPKIVILDEPTAGLDPFERIRLRNYIREIAKDRIVIIATHVMQDIESIADVVILINHGKIVFQGASDDLLSTINHKVFEVDVDDSELEMYHAKYRVSSVYKYDKQYRVRYLDAHRLDGDVTPNFEDAYLYCMVEK